MENQNNNVQRVRGVVLFLGLIGLAALGVGLYGVLSQRQVPPPAQTAAPQPTPTFPQYSWAVTGTVTSKYIAVALYPQFATSFVIVVSCPYGQLHFAADIAYWSIVQPGTQVTIFLGPNTAIQIRGLIIPVWRCDP
jgi:hypothetical protein